MVEQRWFSTFFPLPHSRLGPTLNRVAMISLNFVLPFVREFFQRSSLENKKVNYSHMSKEREGRKVGKIQTKGGKGGGLM